MKVLASPSPGAPQQTLSLRDLLEQQPFLFRLARLQLDDEHEAQDVVQETLIAAADGLAGFSGTVALRAWLTGILRHKVVDLIRQRRRHRALLDELGRAKGLDDFPRRLAEEGDAEIDGMFTDAGDWRAETFCAASCPHGQMERRQQLDLLELCLHLLPPSMGRIFLMREYLGLEPDEIASEVALKPGHVRVLVHRARLKLRACLVQSWGEIR